MSDAKAEQRMRIEYVELGTLQRWPKNPKKHDLAFLDEAFKENGFAEPVLFDEGTKRLVAGHGRLDKLEELFANGAQPPDRIEVRGKKWFVPVVRGVTLRKPEKHVIASNRGVELGGWDNQLLAEMLTTMKEDLIGVGFDDQDVVRFMKLATEAAPPAQFQTFDGTLPTDYCCPKCGHQWSGNPKPGVVEGAPPA